MSRLNIIYLTTSLLVCGWYAHAANMGWKGFVPFAGKPGTNSGGYYYGGHRSGGLGGWGGGK